MDELATGTRDRRGHWWPKEPAGVAPVFVLPPRPRAFLRWLPSHFLPWNVLFLASVAGLHLLMASHPLLVLCHLHYAGFGAAIGYIGFHTIETDEDHGVDPHAFTHYLHHKYFEVNYGEGLVPIDKWMGTWHDGSEEADRLMEVRRARRRRVAA